MMFKIDFERAFSRMDSDHIVKVGATGNKIYIEWHYRNRIIYPIGGGDPFFRKAYNGIFTYNCKDKNEVQTLFDSITKKDSKKIWSQFKDKELVVK